MNKNNYIYSKKIKNIALNSNYQQIVIDGKQYDFDGFKYIPDAFKLKYMNQNKVKDDKIELEDDQMLFISN